MFVLTERLTLRPGWAEDAPALAHAIAHERVVAMLARAPWPYTIDDARGFLSLPEVIDEPRLLIVDRRAAGAPVIGGIGVHRDEHGARELGYWLTPGAWGRGLMREAASAFVASLSASFGIESLVSGHYVGNAASGRVLERIGFRPTGEIRRRYSVARGQEVDCLMHVIDLRQQPRALAA
jgi:RimJ/RimL family protein N-acetyltransferase